MSSDCDFSVVVTTYNRPAETVRCVESCLRQAYGGSYEVIVVDDCSSDDTAQVLAEIFNDSVRVIRHDRNRGMAPARATGVMHASGEWIVVIDSDWELVPHTLVRLAEVIRDLPAGVRAVRSRLRWDDGSVSPAVIPSDLIDYEARIRWNEQLVELDAGCCYHRTVYDDCPYYNDRRGVPDPLWELEVAKCVTAVCVPDVLGIEHATTESYLRGRRLREVVPRILRDAPDMFWVAETMLADHGDALAAFGPRQYREVLRSAVIQAFLCGKRRQGLRYARKAVSAGGSAPSLLPLCLLGIVGPRTVALGAVGHRKLKAMRRWRARPEPGVPVVGGVSDSLS